MQIKRCLTVSKKAGETQPHSPKQSCPTEGCGIRNQKHCLFCFPQALYVCCPTLFWGWGRSTCMCVMLASSTVYFAITGPGQGSLVRVKVQHEMHDFQARVRCARSAISLRGRKSKHAVLSRVFRAGEASKQYCNTFFG